jgi:hypothetical protein
MLIPLVAGQGDIALSDADALGDVTHSNRIIGYVSVTVDRFVDRAVRANCAIRAIGGTAPWYSYS